MDRFYYDDPLAAAWMAKHFGMFFEDDVVDWRAPCAVWGQRILFDDKRKRYIHSDSLPLLEPQTGDLVCGGKHRSVYSVGVSDISTQYCITVEDARALEDLEILRRNGRAFHWPKREEEPE